MTMMTTNLLFVIYVTINLSIQISVCLSDDIHLSIDT